MPEQETITAKVTPLTLELIRLISKRTGEKQYRVFERLAQQAYQKQETKPGPKRNGRK